MPPKTVQELMDEGKTLLEAQTIVADQTKAEQESANAALQEAEAQKAALQAKQDELNTKEEAPKNERAAFEAEKAQKAQDKFAGVAKVADEVRLAFLYLAARKTHMPPIGRSQGNSIAAMADLADTYCKARKLLAPETPARGMTDQELEALQALPDMK